KLISSMFIILILMVASSLGMYNAEHDAQPEAFRNAFSGIWWSVSTLLTVGYGDIYPVTAVGRLMAILIAFLGVGAVAIPTGIISAGFVEQYRRNENSDTKLPDINRIGEIIVEPSGVFTGRTVGEIKREYGMKIYLVIRDDLSIVALDSMKVTNGDILIIESEKLVKSGRKSKKKSK
ncbi:MAG: potassium channel family protein, partial [Huintestinicola sp.]